MMQTKSDLDVIRDAINEAMATAGCSFPNQRVCRGVEMLTEAYGDKTTIKGVIDFLKATEMWAATFRRHLEKHQDQS